MAVKQVILPEIGEGVTEGELVKWLVKPGDLVKADQPVVEMMTDKATVEVPTPYEGVVKELLYKTGDTVKVEDVLLTLEMDGAAGAAAKTDHVQNKSAEVKSAGLVGSSLSQNNLGLHKKEAVSSGGASQLAKTSIASAELPPAELRVLATPSTRKLARDSGVDINQLAGTGLAGRVTREDVLSSLQSVGATGTLAADVGGVVKSSWPTRATLAAGLIEERVKMRGIRKKIAENMQKAKAIIPHFTLMDEANVTALVEIRNSLKAYGEEKKTKLTYLPFVMKALMATVKEFPMFNASIDDAAEEIVYKKYFNMGFAADTPQGLLVPVIKGADQKSIVELSNEITDLAGRARNQKLKPDEMKGATITITNIGSVGGTYATPVINHPEVAILGMYKIQDKLILDAKGQVSTIKVMNFTITADHRLIDGAVAANFLKAFINRIENPAIIMAEMV